MEGMISTIEYKEKTSNGFQMQNVVLCNQKKNHLIIELVELKKF